MAPSVEGLAATSGRKKLSAHRLTKKMDNRHWMADRTEKSLRNVKPDPRVEVADLRQRNDQLQAELDRLRSKASSEDPRRDSNAAVTGSNVISNRPQDISHEEETLEGDSITATHRAHGRESESSTLNRKTFKPSIRGFGSNVTSNRPQDISHKEETFEGVPITATNRAHGQDSEPCTLKRKAEKPIKVEVESSSDFDNAAQQEKTLKDGHQSKRLRGQDSDSQPIVGDMGRTGGRNVYDLHET